MREVCDRSPVVSNEGTVRLRRGLGQGSYQFRPREVFIFKTRVDDDSFQLETNEALPRTKMSVKDRGYTTNGGKDAGLQLGLTMFLIGISFP